MKCAYAYTHANFLIARIMDKRLKKVMMNIFRRYGASCVDDAGKGVVRIMHLKISTPGL